jgi:hypothetical protein
LDKLFLTLAARKQPESRRKKFGVRRDKRVENMGPGM